MEGPAAKLPRKDTFAFSERDAAREAMQDACPHEHWRKVCSSCGRQFESEAANSEIWGREVEL